MIDYYVVDAFTDHPFGGNPAGICVLDTPLSETTMQQIARENALPETAFLWHTPQKSRLRWFTPAAEIDLCGHATLAAAFVVMTQLEPCRETITFETISGPLTIHRQGEQFNMALPLRPPQPLALSVAITDAIGLPIREAYAARDLFLVLDDENTVKNYQPNYEKLRRLTNFLGIVLTAPSAQPDIDFVSRYFCPELASEDPVTGSSHCTLAPLWQSKLGKDRFTAKQCSPREGILHCQISHNQVHITGKATLYLTGKLMIPATNAP